jgi:hypothetical protein
MVKSSAFQNIESHNVTRFNIAKAAADREASRQLEEEEKEQR